MPELNLIEAIHDGLAYEMRRDESVLLLGLDVGRLGGVFRASKGLIDEFGAERVVDTPLAEGSIIGSSIGLAMSGLKPVAEIQFLGFTHQAFHQLAGQLARTRFRNRGRLTTQVTVRAPFGGAVRTPSSIPTPSRPSTCSRQASRSSARRPPSTPRDCSWRRSATPTRSSTWSPSGSTARAGRRSPPGITQSPSARHGWRARATT